MFNPYKYLEKNLPSHLTQDYKRLILRSYISVVKVIFLKALGNLTKGIFYSFYNEEKKAQEFLQGSYKWGREVIKKTKTNLVLMNEVNAPQKGCFIFLNHINELDFPFDCYVIQKPYLANQHIKNTYFAYWWMKAMGSQVFDNTQKRTIVQSIRSLLKALKTHSFIVYPEGQNTYGEEIQSLKKGMVKIAFDTKIPVYLIVKSGVSKLQTKVSENTIGYKAFGEIDPTKYSTWEEFRDFIYETMVSQKKELDEYISKK